MVHFSAVLRRFARGAAWLRATINPEGVDPYERRPSRWPSSSLAMPQPTLPTAVRPTGIVAYNHLRYPVN